MDERQRYLIATIREFEPGEALFSWIEDEIRILEEQEQLAKICDDPLIEDFRVKLGIKLGLKRVLKKPQECRQILK